MNSVKLKIYRRDVRKDGTCGVYLQVLINRRKLDIGLDIKWPPNKFDETVGCKPRPMKTKADKLEEKQTVNALNIIIGNAKTKANDIFLFYHVRDLPIDVDIFRREFHSNMNKNDFVTFFKQKSHHRWNKGLISDNTYKQEKSTLAKLIKFGETIPFNSFHAEWGQEFDLFLRKTYGNEQNTLWSEKKRIRTYLNMAAADGIAFIDPYKRFKVPQKKSRFKALSKTQFNTLLDFYDSKHIDSIQKVVLRRFLFSCSTGLRIGDLRHLTTDNFKDGKMTLDPRKTKRYATQIDAVPLNAMAIRFLEEEKDFTRCARIFFSPTEQYGNRVLKEIAKHDKVKLEHNIHNHIGRSTFASLYDQAGGNHRSLMEYMGLTKVETLMKYVQTNKEVIADGIEKMNSSLSSKE